MKVYHVYGFLSRLLAMLICADAYVCLYVYGEHMVYGKPIEGWLLVPPVLLVVLSVSSAVLGVVYLIRKARVPRRLGVISADVIRECMEASRCTTKS